MYSLMVPRDISPQTLDIRSLYTFHEAIGTGRTGTVYRCTNIQSRDIVAIKVIKAYEIHGFNEYRLCQWVETLIGLDIAGIAKFYKVYADERRQIFYIIMRYYPNGNIANSISGSNRCKWAGTNDERVYAACTRLVSAISFLHNQLWVINTAITGVPLGAISLDNILLDDEFCPCFLPGIGAPLDWTGITFAVETFNSQLSRLAPERILAPDRQKTQPNTGTKIGALDGFSFIRRTELPIAEYMSSNDYCMLLKNKALSLRPTFASDNWALGCLLFMLIFQKYPFRSSKNMHRSYVLPKKIIETISTALKPINEIICGLLVPNPADRMSARQAYNMLTSLNNKVNSVMDTSIEQSVKTDEKLYLAQLKYIISTMDESLAKLSAMLSDSVSAQAEAQEEVVRLSALHTSLEKDVQAKSKTIQELRQELKRTIASMKVDISKADEIDTNTLTNEELISLENECRKLQDKIINTRLLRCSPECVVCFHRPKNIKLDPCKHVCICHECYLQLLDKRCPICRVSIGSVEKVFI
ncbi:Kinase [Giardia lamblia P15]|uniref:Kinase n=1 Tax=Giardia intestinalis (strain P15) TaxID=658858 RepID=E1F8D3_GIAIA|nr:Kinase [Giardia lamblia P15]